MKPGSLQRRTLLTSFAVLGASVVIGCNKIMAAVEQNTLKRRGVGLRAFNSERASPGFTLFAPHFVQNRTVYLIDLRGDDYDRLAKRYSTLQSILFCSHRAIVLAGPNAIPSALATY